MAAAEADKVRAASKKPQRLFVRPLRLRTGVYFFFASEEASYITRPGGFAAATGGGRTESARSASAPRVADFHRKIRLPGAVSAAGASFFLRNHRPVLR